MSLKTISLNSKFKAVSPVLDLSKRSQLHACMELSGSGITLALFTASHELVYLEELLLKAGDKTSDAVEYLAANHDFFAHAYAQVFIGLAHPHYTLVPEPLYDSNAREQLLKLNHNLGNNELVQADEMPGAGSRCVYSVNRVVKETLDRAFPNNHLRHTASCLAESAPSFVSKTHKTAVVNVQGEAMDLCLYDKKLIFMNSFQCQAAEDYLYFILASLEQNGFRPDDTEITLCGEIETGSALHNTLRKYLPKLKFTVAGNSIARKNDLAKLPDHFYFSLYNLYLCAL